MAKSKKSNNDRNNNIRKKSPPVQVTNNLPTTHFSVLIFLSTVRLTVVGPATEKWTEKSGQKNTMTMTACGRDQMGIFNCDPFSTFCENLRVLSALCGSHF